MAGVAVDEGALGGVQNGAEKSNESVGGDGCAEHAVDDAGDARRTVQFARMRADYNPSHKCLGSSRQNWAVSQ
jgi:hypothetical protein